MATTMNKFGNYSDDDSCLMMGNRKTECIRTSITLCRNYMIYTPVVNHTGFRLLSCHYDMGRT